MISSDFRLEARRKLEGKWGKVAVITLSYTFIFFLLGFVQGLFAEGSAIQTIFSLATIVIEIPLSFGLIISLFKIYNSEDVKTFEFWSFGFHNFSKAWGISFRVFLKLILPILLIIISIIFIGIGIASSVFSAIVGNSSAVGNLILFVIIGIILYFVGIIWAIVKSYYYALSFIILADNNNLTAKDAVEESKRLMAGNRGKLFCLQFSFIGWAILASFTFGIGLLWLLPYIQFSIFAFYYFVANKNAVSTERIEEDVIKSNDKDVDSL